MFMKTSYLRIFNIFEPLFSTYKDNLGNMVLMEKTLKKLKIENVFKHHKKSKNILKIITLILSLF